MHLPILAVANDYAPDTGIVYLDDQVYLKYWDDRGVDSFAVKLSPGADLGAFTQETAPLPGRTKTNRLS
ncbi:MAG: hypothetical protein ACYC2T_15610 [Bacillota bacterium]